MRGVSIIIPSLNEEANIRKCLKSISNLDYPLFEVIIADGGSTDRTVKIARKFRKVKIINNPGKYTSAGRNVALKEAMYELVAFIDADVAIPNKNWLRIMVEALESTNDNTVGVGGANLAPEGSPDFVKAISTAQKTFIGNMGSVQGKVFTERQEVESISTCNSLYEKRALFEIGMFDESSKDLGEDWELNFRLRQDGKKLIVEPKSFVWHKFRSNPKSYFSNTYRYGLARIMIMRKHPKSIKIRYLAPFFFLLGMLTIVPFIPYIIIISIVSYKLDKNQWRNIFFVFILLHLGYSLGEWAGLIFGDKYRL